MQQEQQLSLPYEVIDEKKIAGRIYLRENFTVSSRVSYKIPFEQLKIREGFNKRIVYENIPELAASIKSNGLLEPLTVDVLTNGETYIQRGHRRYKAIQMLIEQGEVFDTIECYPNPKSVTELERMEDIFNSNMFACKLNTVEQANVVHDLKNNFGKVSNESIAEKLGISRQQVDNLLLIATADDALKNQILMAQVGIAEALKIIRDNKKAGKQATDAELNANKNTAGKTPLPKDINADELAHLKELEEKEDDLPFDENANIGEGTRFVNPEEPAKDKNEPLNLVGNTVANTKESKKDDDGSVKFDMDREEIKWCQNIIKNLDWLSVVAEKIQPEQTGKDIVQRCNWLQKDMEVLRMWVHRNKKQNKIK